jgi:L-aminopeptidase/D-esterase-like protein
VTVTDVAGVAVGHWTDATARTGCTVVLLPEGTVASGEVRGGAPATRELEVLDPQRLVRHVDAVVLSGGSAFGLAAADGVMTWLSERGRGFTTAAGPVPIVVGLSLFDLLVGDPAVRPGAAEGRAACEAAGTGPVPLGAVGAGTGATVGKLHGREHARPGGLGGASLVAGDLVVSALVAVNAFGEVDDGRLDGAPEEGIDPAAVAEALATAFTPVPPPGEHTTIGVVVSNAVLGKVDCLVVAQGAHDGLARALVPTHTRVDGDAFVAAGTGAVEAHVDVVRHLALVAVERAVRSAAR